MTTQNGITYIIQGNENKVLSSFPIHLKNGYSYAWLKHKQQQT